MSRERGDPDDDIIDRTDRYYVYLKPHGADDNAIRKRIGKLGKTAVGTHERGLFITFPTLTEMRATMQQICGSKGPLEPDKISGVLLELAPGAKTQQVRFAVLANFPGVKVVSGESMLTSVLPSYAACCNLSSARRF
jgi:hypothetical protein